VKTFVVSNVYTSDDGHQHFSFHFLKLKPMEKV